MDPRISTESALTNLCFLKAWHSWSLAKCSREYFVDLGLLENEMLPWCGAHCSCSSRNIWGDDRIWVALFCNWCVQLEFAPLSKGSTIGTVPNSVRYLQLVTFTKWQAGNGTSNGGVTSWVYPRPTIQKEGNEQSHSGSRFHESLGGGTFEHFIACYKTRHSPNWKKTFLLMEKIQLISVEIVKTSPKTAAENGIFTKHQLVIVGLCPSTQYLWLLHWHPFDPLIGTLGHFALPLRRRFDDAMSNDLSGLRQIRQGRRLEVWKRHFLLKQESNHTDWDLMTHFCCIEWLHPRSTPGQWQEYKDFVSISLATQNTWPPPSLVG